MKTSALLCVALMLLAFPSYNPKISERATAAQPTSDISITLIPNAGTYDLAKVPLGVVNFTATIRNGSLKTITIAHPSICFPAEFNLGNARHFKDNHGKSEILLEITRPNGIKVTLRDGWIHFFDPNSASLITIPPGGKGSFLVGWFFQNARGRWENDDEAWTVFLDKGTYQVRILFRNIFPKAYNHAANEPEFVNVWTGEMQSEKAVVEIR